MNKKVDKDSLIKSMDAIMIDNGWYDADISDKLVNIGIRMSNVGVDKNTIIDILCDFLKIIEPMEHEGVSNEEF